VRWRQLSGLNSGIPVSIQSRPEKCNHDPDRDRNFDPDKSDFEFHFKQFSSFGCERTFMGVSTEQIFPVILGIIGAGGISAQFFLE